MVIIGKVFQEGFLFVIKSFLKSKEELQPNIDLLTLDNLKTFFLWLDNFLKVVTFYGLDSIYGEVGYQWVACPQ
jgi:hypothetical protein